MVQQWLRETEFAAPSTGFLLPSMEKPRHSPAPRVLLGSSLALLVLLALGGCGSPADDDPLITVTLTGCLECSAAPEDVIRADQTTAVTSEGEVSGKAVPTSTGLSAEYEFEGYQLAPRQLRRLNAAVSEVDFAALADRHPPKYEENIDARLAYTITHEGKSYEIGDPDADNYEKPRRQARLFTKIVGIVGAAQIEASGTEEELEEIRAPEGMVRDPLAGPPH